MEYWTIEIIGRYLFCSVYHNNYFMGERNDILIFDQATLGM